MDSNTHKIMAALNAEMNPEFYQGLVKLFHELRIHMPKVHDHLDTGYLEYIYSNISKKRCDLLAISHLGKYKVDQFLKLKKRNPDTPEVKTKKNSNNIFTEFIITLQRASHQNKDKLIPFSSKSQLTTFTTLFNQSGLKNNGYTAKSVKNALIQAGCLEEHPDKILKFITSVPNSLTTNQDSIRQASAFLNRYGENMVHNRNLKEGDVKYFEKSILSTEIPPELIKDCANDFYSFMLPQYLDGQKLIDRYEKPNIKSTHDVGFHVMFFAQERA